MTSYVATDVYHHADGVVAPGEVAELTDEQAERGLARGVLVAAQQPKSTTKPSAKGGAESKPEE